MVGRWGHYVGGSYTPDPRHKTSKSAPSPRQARYVECPSCHRLTPTDTGYCYHCNAPLIGSLHLSPPKDYRWDLVLGLDEGGTPVGIKLRDLEEHLVVYGSVGTGKTTMIKQLLYEASYNSDTTYTVIDWEGEYIELGEATAARILYSDGSPQSLKINILDPGPLHPADYASWLTTILLQTFSEEGWSITSQMEALLRRAILASIIDRIPATKLAKLIYAAAKDFPQGYQTAAALETRLSRLLEGAAATVIDDTDNTRWLARTRTVIDLSHLARTSPPDARFIVKILLGRIRHQARLYSHRPNTHLVVVEEAEHIAAPLTGHRGLTLVAQAMMELRKRRVGIIVVAHSPSLLDPAINKLANNIAVFALHNNEDVKIAASTLSPTNTEIIAARIQELKRGEFILSASSARTPFLVKTATPVVDVKDNARRLLNSIYTHPYFSTRERRTYLGMNGAVYQKAVQYLLARGILRIVLVHQGRGRPVKLLQPRGMNPSVAHCYAAHNAAKTLESMPIISSVVTEPGDGADIAAVASTGQRIAVEIETGTHINTAKYINLLEKGYDYVVIICTNHNCSRHARNTIKRINPERIVVTMLAFLEHTITKLLSLHKREAREAYAH